MSDSFNSSEPTIKIDDDPHIREQIEELGSALTQKQNAKWAMLIAKRALQLVEPTIKQRRELRLAMDTNELWQVDLASVYQVRQAAAKIHDMARESATEVSQTALQLITEAINTGFQKEAALRAADYGIRLVNLQFPDTVAASSAERQWQLGQLDELAQNIGLKRDML